jgi:hypothetical protein
MECKCHEIEDEINKKHPNCSWNVDAACEEWNTRSSELEDADIEYEPGSDELYGCTCPTCGRLVCGWCV